MFSYVRDLLQTEMSQITLKGVHGILATTGGIYVSFLPQIEAWLRVLSLFIGIAVGFGTLISIVFKIRRDLKK